MTLAPLEAEAGQSAPLAVEHMAHRAHVEQPALAEESGGGGGRRAGGVSTRSPGSTVDGKDFDAAPQQALRREPSGPGFGDGFGRLARAQRAFAQAQGRSPSLPACPSGVMQALALTPDRSVLSQWALSAPLALAAPSPHTSTLSKAAGICWRASWVTTVSPKVDE